LFNSKLNGRKLGFNTPLSTGSIIEYFVIIVVISRSWIYWDKTNCTMRSHLFIIFINIQTP